MDREQVIGWLEGYAANRRTICEVFREIYDEVCDMPDSPTKRLLEDLIIEGFRYGKKMNKKLVSNKALLQSMGLVKEKACSLPKNKNKARNKNRRSKRVEARR